MVHEQLSVTQETLLVNENAIKVAQSAVQISGVDSISAFIC
jgi:hypothetical protein